VREEIIAFVLVIIVGVLVLYGNLRVFKRVKVEKGRSIFSLLKEANISGFASGVVRFPEGSCIQEILDVEIPCMEGPGIYANDLYCFSGAYYEVNITKNDKGGLCIVIEEVEE